MGGAEAADIVLLVDDVTHVGEAVASGQRTLCIARQSIGVGLGLGFALMVVAGCERIPPTVGALYQEVVAVAVILNALRARQGAAQVSACAGTSLELYPDFSLGG